ncbi:MAG: NlpC/P60 family protein [Proteobacteria bacterium]|nr:NlpC/P60 family protein [Pseudomonadota bacterium]
MTDRRLTPHPDWATGADPATIAVPVADLLATPQGPRDRQLLMGEAVTVLGQKGGIAHVRAEKDLYHGFVADTALGPAATPTHRVAAPAAHAYAAPDIKSPDLLSLSFGARVTATAETEKFIETALGHIPKQHLKPADSHEGDPAATALLFLGTPYLWGGNSRAGIDCSGLVQAALLACGTPCPGDSDLQARAFGPATGPRRRGDLLFWKGHVAMALDDARLIHANAYHMATAIEDADTAVTRINDPLLAHLRP